MTGKTEGTFKLNGITWSWRTFPNKDVKNHPHSLYRTVIKADGLTFVWLHSDGKLDPKATLQLQFLSLKERT